MDLPNWLDWTGTRYFAATLLGFLVALAVEMAADAASNRRKRQFIREALAEEIAWNLFVLDEQFAALLNIHREPAGPLRFSRQQLLSRIMAQCIDPETGSLLSTPEWLHAVTAIQQCDDTNAALEEMRQRLLELSAVPDRNLRTHYAQAESARLINHQLPALGQTLMEMLCQIMERQVEYNSKKMMRIVVALIPAWSGGAINADCTWRVRYLPDLQQRRGTLIAWKNDANEDLPSGLTVIEIDPGPGGDQVKRPDPGLLARIAKRMFSRSTTANVRKTYLESERNVQQQPIRPLTDLYSEDDGPA
ncbi:MAG: hypothetical protein ACRDHN_19850 [Thermomicrobiales bacterium]